MSHSVGRRSAASTQPPFKDAMLNTLTSRDALIAVLVDGALMPAPAASTGCVEGVLARQTLEEAAKSSYNRGVIIAAHLLLHRGQLCELRGGKAQSLLQGCRRLGLASKALAEAWRGAEAKGEPPWTSTIHVP